MHISGTSVAIPLNQILLFVDSTTCSLRKAGTAPITSIQVLLLWKHKIISARASFSQSLRTRLYINSGNFTRNIPSFRMSDSRRSQPAGSGSGSNRENSSQCDFLWTVRKHPDGTTDRKANGRPKRYRVFKCNREDCKFKNYSA